MTIQDRISELIRRRGENNSLRSLTTYGYEFVDFSSNDYLGMSRISVLSKVMESGSGGSRLITGNFKGIELLEETLATQAKMPAALVFNSGYSANLGLFSCVPQRGDIVLYDSLSHASIRDGIKLSNARAFSFRHNDLSDLKNKLERFNGQNIFVVTESIFSMDGDSPDLNALVGLKELFDFELIIDEAHSYGLIGENGEGLVTSLCIENKVFAKVVTFGKALGMSGAAIIGSGDLKSYLINFSRPFIYTTGISPKEVDALSIRIEQNKSLINRNLTSQHLKNKFLREFNGLLPLVTGPYGNIVGVVIAGNTEVKKVATHLLERKLLVKPILSPTVEKGKERLRICFHEFNTEEEVDLLCKEIKEGIELI